MKLNILIVEDDRSTSNVLAYILEILGHLSVETDSIQKGKEALAGAVFDLVISDLNLPDGLGTDFLNEVLLSHPEMKQILISGGTDPKGHGAVFKAKPFNKTQIEELLRNVFQTVPR